MAIAIPPIPSLPTIAQTPESAAASTGANGASVSGTDFLSQLGQAIDGLQRSQAASNVQANAVADGTGNITDFMVGAEQVNLQTQLTDTLAQKATAAFNLIMSMQI